jgi:hypothetical protein
MGSKGKEGRAEERKEGERGKRTRSLEWAAAGSASGEVESRSFRQCSPSTISFEVQLY